MSNETLITAQLLNKFAYNAIIEDHICLPFRSVGFMYSKIVEAARSGKYTEHFLLYDDTDMSIIKELEDRGFKVTVINNQVLKINWSNIL